MRDAGSVVVPDLDITTMLTSFSLRCSNICSRYCPETLKPLNSRPFFKPLCDFLENAAVPLFYTRTADNLPRAWIQRMKNSLKWIAPRFNTHRMIAEYAQNFYIPAGRRWHFFNDEDFSKAKAISKWKSEIKKVWQNFAIKNVLVSTNGKKPAKQLSATKDRLIVGAKLNVRALVKLGPISPKDVSVELYHGPLDTWGSISDGTIEKMDYEQSPGDDGEHWFKGRMACKMSGRQGLAVRVLPKHADITNPCDLGLILWEDKTN